MEIRLQKKDDLAILELTGRLDTLTSPVLEKSLLDLIADNERQLIIDFSQLNYISSVGLRVFLIASKQLKTVHGRMVLCGQSEAVKGVFDMTGFSQLFKIFPSQDEAIKEITKIY
jgi:anti-sigma B factor antagonist